MNNKTIALLAACILPSTSFAQSTVSVWGLLDSGVSYVSNESGHGKAKYEDNIYVPNLLGFEGKEDLGAGTHAIFQLVNQYSLGTGSIIGSGLFARTAYVGLENQHYGKLTLGNQYEFMVDALAGSGNEIAPDLVGLYAHRNGPFDKLDLPDNPTGAFDWDRVAGSNRVPNSIKYTSAPMAGFTAGVLYGFSSATESAGANNTVSAGASYNGGGFGGGVAYTNQKYASANGIQATSIRNYGAGLHYTVGTTTAKALFTSVRNAQNGAGIWSIESGALWHLPGAWSAGAAYLYMKGNDKLESAHAHQVSTTVHYALSQRTMLYVAAVHQRASRGSTARINGDMGPGSGSSNMLQSIVRLGLSTRF